MMKKAVILGLAAYSSAGTLEVSTNDLSGGTAKAYANIKGAWSQGVSIFGRSATLTAEYDRNERDNFLSEVTLSGALDKVKYELSTKFGSAKALTLGTTTDDGTALEIESEISDLHMKVTKLSASRATTLRGQACDLELSHALGDNESKLKLSSVLGSGVSATGSLTTKGGASSVAYEVDYETDLTKGRKLTANVKPQDGSGEIEYVDSATLDGTITANVPLGGKPTVSIKRAWSF